MNWIRDNKFLTTVIVLAILILAVGGFFLSKLHAAFAKERRLYNDARRQIESLRALPVYPNKKNLAKRSEDLQKYEEQTEKLENSLVQNFQRPLAEKLSETDLAKKMKQVSSKLQSMAVNKGTQLSDGFYVGMESYRNDIPRAAAVSRLDFVLDGLDYVTQTLIEAEALSLKIERDKLAVERGANLPEPLPFVERYPFRIFFKGKERTLRKLVNEISNCKDYFFVIRKLRIDNDKKVSPLKGKNNVAPRRRRRSDPEEESDRMTIAFGAENISVRVDAELIRFNPPKSKTAKKK